MKNQLILILFTLLSTYGYSQITFQDGYYIGNNGEKIECQIKNIDWKNNPTEFRFRLSENSEVKKTTIKLVKEFGIYNYSKYIRRSVNIDRSSNNINKLSTSRNPVFKEEVLFLKVLVEGKSSLYEYVERNLDRFFYSKNDLYDIEQLIFKTFKSSNDAIVKNTQFRQQLLNDLKCENSTANRIQKIGYSKKPLVSLFVKYNQCSNSDATNFVEKEKKDPFNLNIRPRLNSSSLSIQNPATIYGVIDFETNTNLGFGLEAEFILSFNKNKWSIIVEPAFQSFKGEVESSSRTFTVAYKSIQFATGIRHYFFLNDKSKLFINGSYNFDFQNKSIIDLNPGVDLEIGNGQNLGFGLGYKQNDKYSLEFRYQSPRGVISGYEFWSSEYKTITVIFGYSIF